MRIYRFLHVKQSFIKIYSQKTILYLNDLFQLRIYHQKLTNFFYLINSSWILQHPISNMNLLPNSKPSSRYQHHTFILKAFKNSQLLKYPKLTELYFNPTSHIYLDPRAFTKLCNGLKTLKSLNVLYLNFSYTKELDDQSLRELSLALRQLHGLTILSLNFKQNRKITAKGITELLKTVKNNRFLIKLYLDFSECGEVEETQLEPIYDSISSMKLLTSFHLNHFHIPLLPTFGEKLANNLVKLRRLHYMKDFSINFTLWHGLKTLEILALSKVLRRMVRLYKLSLNSIGSIMFSKESMESFVNSLKSLPKLQKLHLHFLSSNTNQDCFDLTYKAFENSLTLSHLILDFSCAHVTSSATKNLLISLQTLKNLSKLELNFSNCLHSNNDVIQLLSQGISNLTNLSSLKLNFSKCPLTISSEKNLRRYSIETFFALNRKKSKIKISILHLFVDVF